MAMPCAMREGEGVPARTCARSMRSRAGSKRKMFGEATSDVLPPQQLDGPMAEEMMALAGGEAARGTAMGGGARELAALRERNRCGVRCADGWLPISSPPNLPPISGCLSDISRELAPSPPKSRAPSPATASDRHV